MEWNLLPVLNYDGKRMPLDACIELSGHPGDDFRILGAVNLCGEIVNIGGSLELTAEGKARVERTCDRCAEPFVQEITFTLQERMKKADATEDGAEDPDILLIEGNTIDLAQLAYSGLYISLSSKALCRVDCKGLCPMCGKNLNLGVCDCDTRTTDPRFDVLDQLL